MQKFDRKKFRKPIPRANKTRGLVLFFCGDGKGKTTAAIGTAVRASGAGMNVCVVQFMKTEKWKSYERASLRKLQIPMHVLGSGFVGILDDTHALSWHKARAKKALQFATKLLSSKKYDVFVADELVSCVEEGLLTQRDVLAFIKNKPLRTHLILTGHTLYPAIVKASDTVTNMKMVKHPFHTDGTTAQRGIDF